MWIENIFIVLGLLSFRQTIAAPSYEEQRHERHINDMTKDWKQIEFDLALADFNFETNKPSYKDKLIDFQQKKIDVYNSIKTFNTQHYHNEELKRRIHNLGMLRLSELNATQYIEVVTGLQLLGTLYKDIKIKPFIKPGVTEDVTEERVKELIRNTKDVFELEHYWKESNERGALVKKMFTDVVPQMKNLSYYTDPHNKLAMYYLPYEDPNLFKVIEQCMNQLRPLYEKMHAYIRFVMQKDFGDWEVANTSSICEAHFNHVLENVAALELDQVLAYKKLDSFKKNEMLKEAEDWLRMLGLPKLPDAFWEKKVQIFTPPCEPMFFDFSTEARMYACSDKTAKNYYKNYRLIVGSEYVTLMSELQPGLLGEPCPGFRDAIELAVELSVKSLDNIRKAGLSTGDVNSERVNINKLAYMFFTDIIPLFKHFVYEKFIVDILNGTTSAGRYNCAYLKTLHGIMGLRPPYKRSSSLSDIPIEALKTAEYANTKEIVSRILGYQLFSGFCKISDDEKPYGSDLVNCNFKSSLAVGKELHDIMTSGKKKTWRETIERVVPGKQLNASAIVDYFSPLDKILTEILKENDIHIGWEKNLGC